MYLEKLTGEDIEELEKVVMGCDSFAASKHKFISTVTKIYMLRFGRKYRPMTMNRNKKNVMRKRGMYIMTLNRLTFATGRLSIHQR